MILRPASEFYAIALSESDLPDPSAFETFTPFLKGVFSQWHPTRFRIDGRDFNTAEQWMMFAKACVFEDAEAAQVILATDDPSVQKRLGQQVRGFDGAVWDEVKLGIVLRGNVEKFAQNAGARRQLKATAPSMLVEANPRDWIWGCGLSADDPAIQRPNDWSGENFLGRVLTKVRDQV